MTAARGSEEWAEGSGSGHGRRVEGGLFHASWAAPCDWTTAEDARYFFLTVPLRIRVTSPLTPRAMLRSATAALLAACLLPVSLAAQSAPSPASTGVRPGDRITVDFYTASGDRPAEINGAHIVDRNGTIFLPFVGSVPVDGKDAAGIRTELQTAYKPYFSEPVISVSTELRVNVTGVVGHPGHYFLDPAMTVVDALAEAGGPGLDVDSRSIGVASDPAAVRLIRAAGQVLTLDLRPEHISSEVMNLRIESGDWIYVPPQTRSRLRDDVQFWGSVVGLFTSILGFTILIAR